MNKIIKDFLENETFKSSLKDEKRTKQGMKQDKTRETTNANTLCNKETDMLKESEGDRVNCHIEMSLFSTS